MNQKTLDNIGRYHNSTSDHHPHIRRALRQTARTVTYRYQERTKVTKACIKSQKRVPNKAKMTSDGEESSQSIAHKIVTLELTFWPNYGIFDEKISINDKLPTKKQHFSFLQLHSDEVASKMLEDAVSDLDRFVGCIGQLVVLFKKHSASIEKIVATFCVIRDPHNQGSLSGLSVLHALPEFTKDFSTLLVLSKRSCNVDDILGSFIKNQTDPYSVANKLLEQQPAHDFEFYRLEEKHYKQWLERRRNFLSKCSTDLNKRELLFDPMFHLQPLPSIDLLLFQLPEALQAKFIIENKSILQVPNQEQFNKAYEASDGHGFLLAFHSTTDKIDLADSVYDKSLTTILRPSIIPSCFLVNPGKSISVVKLSACCSDSLFLFQGTTQEGSSGGPIISKDGYIIGISFGCYEDTVVETSAESDNKKSCAYFDQKYPEEENYVRSKNHNIAISSRHPILTQELDVQNVSSKQKKEDSQVKKKSEVSSEESKKYFPGPSTDSHKKRSATRLFLSKKDIFCVPSIEAEIKLEHVPYSDKFMETEDHTGEDSCISIDTIIQPKKKVKKVNHSSKSPSS